jgi:hypothetical protein
MRQEPRALGDIPVRAAAIGAAVLIPPAVSFVWFQHNPSYDLVFGSHTWHFFIVSVVAAMATVLALTVMRAARHLPEPRTFFLAMGFFAMAGIFLAHGLGTAPSGAGTRIPQAAPHRCRSRHRAMATNTAAPATTAPSTAARLITAGTTGTAARPGQSLLLPPKSPA